MSNENSTGEVKDVKKAERRAAKKESYATLKKIADATKNEEMKNALIVIRPSLYGITSSGGGGSNKVLDAIVAKGQMNELELFQTMKVGRREVASIIRKHLKRSEPAKRVWINFDEKLTQYKVVGKGPEAPKNYDGYIPVEKNTNLK